MWFNLANRFTVSLNQQASHTPLISHAILSVNQPILFSQLSRSRVDTHRAIYIQ